ncbi:13.88 kDa late protein [Escherichia phage 590B]|nr:13.88 kDa late protein [Escherichia phage 590B]
MLEKFLVLLERFVVAHELIAANSAKQVVQVATPLEVETVSYTKEAVAECAEEATKEIPVEGEDIVDAKPAEEEKPKRKPRKAKVEEPTPEPEEEKEEVDYQSLRDQIQAIDDAINEGPSDAACDDSDELLEEFTGKKMKIAAIKDEDLAEYLKRLTAIKNKYFEEE